MIQRFERRILAMASLAMCAGIACCGGRSPAPGKILLEALGEIKIEPHGAVSVLEIEAHIASIPRPQADLSIGDRSVLLPSALREFDVDWGDGKAGMVHLSMRGDRLNFEQELDASRQASVEGYTGKDKVTVMVGNWSGSFQPPLSSVALTSAGGSTVGARYAFFTADEQFTYDAQKKMGYLRGHSAIAEAAGRTLTDHGFDAKAVHTAVAAASSRLDGLSDENFLTEALHSNGSALATEPDLQKCVEGAVLQAALDPDWAISFKVGGNRAIAFKIRHPFQLDFSAYYSIFSERGESVAGGSICFKGTPTTQEVADRICAALGDLPPNAAGGGSK